MPGSWGGPTAQRFSARINRLVSREAGASTSANIVSALLRLLPNDCVLSAHARLAGHRQQRCPLAQLWGSNSKQSRHTHLNSMGRATST